MQSEISSIKAVKQKLQQLKQQIKFRKFVLQQEYDDPSFFRFSKSKKQFPVSVLMANLVKLVNATSDPELEPTTIPPEYENNQFAQNPELILIYHTCYNDCRPSNSHGLTVRPPV